MTHTPRATRGKFEKLNDFVGIFQREGKWHANIQWQGRQIRRSLKTASKKQAQLNALALGRTLMDEKAPLRQQRAAIAEVVEAFLEWKQTEGLAKRSLAKYEFALKTAIALASSLKLKHIHQVDPRFMDRFRSDRKKMNSSPKTIACDLVILRGLVKFALSRRYLTEDPLVGYKIKKPKLTPQPCWSPPEVELILSRSKRQPHHDVYVVLADTGMRVGELINLTWEDVDFRRNVIQIRAKKNWKPKTGDARAIPMSDRVAAVLKSQPRRFQWIFTFPRSDRGAAEGRQVSDRRLLEYLKRVLKKLGLVGHVHTFRHSHISHAIARGVSIPVLRGWIGHVDPKTLEIYTHLSDQTAQEAMRALCAPPKTSALKAEMSQAEMSQAEMRPKPEATSSTNLAHPQEDEKCA